MNGKKKDALEKLKAQVLTCKQCPLHKKRIQAVFGEGSYDARIFIIGEGPGAIEDQLGRPFVGRAGKFLDHILEKYGLSRNSNVFISNIVKCRPPENRIPTTHEINSCFPYLKQQIELINPHILVLLGSTALKSFMGTHDKISELRGQWMEINGRLLLPTFHPAAGLRNPAYKKALEKDIQKLSDQSSRISIASP